MDGPAGEGEPGGRLALEPVLDPALDPAFGPAGGLPDWPPGTAVEIVKLAPDGTVAARYPGVVRATVGDWLVAEARWVNRDVTVGGLAFRTGDRLAEWFSARHPFNAFAVLPPGADTPRGWYANVTYPTRFDPAADPPRITWHDLYLDVVTTAGRGPATLDEDELEASGMASADPALHAAVVAAAAHAAVRLRAGQVPFTPSGWPPAGPDEGVTGT
jgi:hypothetical protein